ncbi:alpha/beta fold hydrolase [Dasania sp. GY-MA-18]|uniref:Alpha/beta fold hydrolase n=1 Tax=Dasania phycosphaerae TaxID=2950436 RepID=A0A9J6RKD9_9GAMM|nr:MULTISPECIES: alpha/beta fold hydrolase [Dasania]MCR8922736.1 alpha/beta fold hydrolase [Dasania sp. GY-MA-18]MCZ0865166.1 alpha/beta fold hydrolase [Dasania phycosphaerae]MCZ0868892.1 alpha/beta fold hydrolase [Dasania phycosphaerae]
MSKQALSLYAQVEATEAANAETVLLLHGLFGMGVNLGAVAKALAAHYQVHSLDLRNHGQSPHSECMGYELMAADVLAYMDVQGIAQAHVLGHSMGGKVAMQLALSQPQRVSKLIVADISPVAYEANHTDVFAGLNAVDFDTINNRRDAEAVLAQHVQEPAVRQFLLRNMYRDENKRFAWRMNVAALEANYDAIKAGLEQEAVFEGEVLFIKGEQSDYILPEHRERILQLFPKASVKVIQNTGHWLHAEKPAAFNLLCLNFLAKS